MQPTGKMLRACANAILLAAAALAFGQETAGFSAGTVLVITHGITANGVVTRAWHAAIRGRHDPELLPQVLAGKPKWSQAEADWANLIHRRAVAWPAMIDSLRIPFVNLPPPGTIAILLGNRGGEDAFLFADSIICFDLHKLQRQYGPATAAANHDKIDRLFAHEFTHVLHKAWRRQKGLILQSPFEAALWECLTEGLGNYRSLSSKWLSAGGELTPHAQEVLARLQPILVERLAALAQARPEESGALMKGLSSGPFDQKWGALPVALWLAQEARGDERNLRQWVEAGPPGVLQLAQKYLPASLKKKMPANSR
ncbi:MAG: hypothetical protein ONB48_00245 [candidate division KSB1 bacterium]|nr:hypothetical protein [candidate division KSB1 bacterium]MDZ7272895.1 hypothetical protein [candidate division KSB1 bacterium]MDZ7284082.1 hypothetical protein [candidate division KSB1 bacterium]MDZ7297520.1 hypothetical protein [candidate division KSB1 bacterium]MDZ7308256.1 hypothetical protein [candidate division KSB1 bacterium]